MDAVLTAYKRTHRDSRRGRRTDESIRGEIMSLVGTEYHKSRRRDGLRELPRFQVVHDSCGTEFIRATDKDDSNPSPSLPTDATPERWFRAQIAEQMRTGICGICHDPLASQNDVRVLVGCCLNTLHLRCLQRCIAQPHARKACPFCRHPLGNEPSEIEDPSEIAAEWSGLQEGFYSDSTSVSSEESSHEATREIWEHYQWHGRSWFCNSKDHLLADGFVIDGLPSIHVKNTRFFGGGMRLNDVSFGSKSL